jgi:ribulose-5-phosphate 4-epimerase/fuculose-1-phosphate aldolase
MNAITDLAAPRRFKLEERAPASSFAEERLHRKQRLAATFRLFARYGFDQGLAGHVTARDPEFPEQFWINPLARHFHAARPAVIAAAHTHSTYGKAFSTLGRLLDPLTQDACAFYEDHAVFDPFTGVVLDENEGVRLAETLGSRKALILQNHGLLTVGPTVEAAAWWFIAMDNAAHTQLLADAAGKTRPVAHDIARHTASQTGTHKGGAFSFQPLWEMIVAAEPDLLD